MLFFFKAWQGYQRDLMAGEGTFDANFNESYIQTYPESRSQNTYGDGLWTRYMTQGGQSFNLEDKAETSVIPTPVMDFTSD